MHYQILIILFASLISFNAYSSEMSEEELEAWFNEDEHLPIQVDEGELILLPKTDNKTLHSISEIRLNTLVI